MDNVRTIQRVKDLFTRAIHKWVVTLDPNSYIKAMSYDDLSSVHKSLFYFYLKNYNFNSFVMINTLNWVAKESQY